MQKKNVRNVDKETLKEIEGISPKEIFDFLLAVGNGPFS